MKTTQSRRKFVRVSATGGAVMALGVGSGEALGGSVQSGGQEPLFFETAKGRRSVRKFEPMPIPEAHISQILDVARSAPTSGNQQPWKFLVVRDRALLDGLRERCIEASVAAREARGVSVSEEDVASIEGYFTDYLSAPVYVVVLTDNESRYPAYNHWDGPLAAGYLMLAARALGYGTVFATDSIPEQVTREHFNIPDRYTRVCITPVGVPVAWPESPPKKALDEFIVLDRF